MYPCFLSSFGVGSELYFRISAFLFLCVFMNVCLYVCDSLSLSFSGSLRGERPLFSHCRAFFGPPSLLLLWTGLNEKIEWGGDCETLLSSGLRGLEVHYEPKERGSAVLLC